MTILAQSTYPKDLTMSMASNHIQNETKDFDIADQRIFVPDGGPFYSESLIIKDSNGVDLRPELDYKLLHLHEAATVESGRDVVCVIWVLTDTISSVSLDYRVVGGSHGNTVAAIIQELNNSGGSAGGNVDWNGDVFGKPDQYPPAPHYHSPETFTSWSVIYNQLDGIRKAIISGDLASWESHYNYINRRFTNQDNNFKLTLDGYATREYVASVVGQGGGSSAPTDLSNYYNKVEVDSKFVTTDGNITSLSNNVSNNYYTKTQVDASFASKTDSYSKLQSDGRYALKGDVYTKVESDNKYATITSLNGYVTTLAFNQYDATVTQRIAAAVSGGTIDLSNYYDKTQTYGKTEVYSKLESYAKSQLYTKVELDAKFEAITNSINILSAAVPRYRIVNVATNYTLVAADTKGDTIVRCTSATATTITIPVASAGMVVGSVVSIRQVGEGSVTLKAGPGVTVSPSDSLVMRRAGVTATLVYVDNNTYDLITELS